MALTLPMVMILLMGLILLAAQTPPVGVTDGDGTLDDERRSGSATDVENAEGFLANTGANGTVLLVLGGLLSVAFGVSAWQISRRRNGMN